MQDLKRFFACRVYFTARSLSSFTGRSAGFCFLGFLPTCRRDALD